MCGWHLVRHATREVPAIVEAVDSCLELSTLDVQPASELALNDVGRVRLRLAEPLVVDPYAGSRATGGFLLLDPAGGGTVGAGRWRQRPENEKRQRKETVLPPTRTNGTGSFDAVIFDLDGVLVDSEQTWDDVRRAVVAANGGHWTDEATRAMQGMSTPEWARYLVGELGATLTSERIAEAVVDEMARRYADRPPVLPGAEETVRSVAEHYPVAIASSSPPVLITAFLEATSLTGTVGVAVSSEQVPAGKPAPDVYLEAARRLGVAPGSCAAVEDTTNGLRAALAAGMTVYAVPNPHFPPDPAVLEQATAVLDRIAELPAVVQLTARKTA